LSDREPFQNFQYVFDHPDGQPRHFRVNGKPVFDDAGEFQGYRGTGRDVTEEIEARREVQKQTLLLEATLEHMAQGISVVGPDLKALAFNRRFLEMLEFPPEQFSVGDSFEKFIRYNIERGEYGDGPVEDIVAEKVAQAREFKPHKFERKRPNGLVMEVEGRPLPGGGFVTTYTDVTERHHTAERLVAARTAAEAANTAKTMFLANMSHELRTPLNGVIGFAALLAEQRFGQIGERYVGYALDIKNCGEHLLAIINDILDLAKVETGAAEHRCEAIGFRQAAAECLNLMSSQASRGQIALSNDVPVKGDTVWADPRFLRQILLNLISNAIKFSEPGGQVSVAFEARQGATVLHVVDQGIGISEEDLEHVFEPFVQVGSGYDRKYEGTGLGLALVRRLVDLHGGDISIDSTLGEGTTVTISLPLPADVGKRADQKLAAAGDD
jgi:signal transduction histidine kinase